MAGLIYKRFSLLYAIKQYYFLETFMGIVCLTGRNRYTPEKSAVETVYSGR
jgi:hypothetical protein